MKIFINNDSYYNLNVFLDRQDRRKKTLVFFHGFTGSNKDWHFIKNDLLKEYNLIFIDLAGHGSTLLPGTEEYFSTQNQINHIHKLLDIVGTDKIILFGYSMGGRLALSFAEKYPENITALILESTSPGIPEEEERETRIKHDLSITEIIEKSSLEDFFIYWYNQPIFATLSEKIKKEKLLNNFLQNNKSGLISSLRYFGTGEMPSLWNKIKNLHFPVLLITGKYDSKFSLINNKMNNLLPESSHKEFDACGHNVHLEKPTDFTIFIKEFLNNL